MSFNNRLYPPNTLSAAFSIASQSTDISILIFHATSLSAAKTFQLSLDTHRDRPPTTDKVRAIQHSFYSLGQSIPRAVIESAIYLGRARENRLIYVPFSDEPCLYLVCPHLRDKSIKRVEMLLRKVVMPAFKRALAEYEVPQIQGGAKRAAPPICRDFRMLLTIPKYYEVIAHSEDHWVPGGTRDESMDAARSRILHLAWKHMKKIVGGSGEASVFEFWDMKLIILVPWVDHQVGTNFNQPFSGVWDFEAAVREAMSLYNDDLNPEFLEGAKVVFMGEYELKVSEGSTDY
ncbi:hypothetical protein PTT_09477 [Pyrenophora teres f. teres 0-1]|uniref:Uncharacterized protein n=1 Tax=Pyrenophora teres f. teres (strain 0-1) TaxID=861557 RepID=E3RM38_PYRTT|nr:hypothetical protein PTT_09477 [Pyrenophora teres f. teres 0-1]